MPPKYEAMLKISRLEPRLTVLPLAVRVEQVKRVDVLWPELQLAGKLGSRMMIFGMLG
jgi:hypothetical protein